MKEICKNCIHCKPTYKGGRCEIKNKKVRMSGECSCDNFRPKGGRT